MELEVIKDVFCTSNRKEPLNVGSVKSNIGHIDVLSCFVGMVKSIIAMETGYIPPNINYNVPNSLTDAHKSGQLQVIFIRLISTMEPYKNWIYNVTQSSLFTYKISIDYTVILVLVVLYKVKRDRFNINEPILRAFIKRYSADVCLFVSFSQ